MRRETVGGAVVLAVATAIACLVSIGGMAVTSRITLPTGPLGMPMAETLFTAIIFAPLLVLAVVAARLDGASALAAGRDGARNAAFGLAIGFAGLLAAVGDAHLAGTLASGTGEASAALLPWGVVVILFQAGSEEVFFRGWLQPALTRRWGGWPALLATAAAFAIAHMAGGERAPLALLNLLLGGLVFGLLAQRGGGLAGAVGAHFGWNASEQLVWGLDPNPGVGSFGALADHDLVGGAAWGGSTQGLNGSIAMAAVLLAILVPLVLARGNARTGMPATA